MHTAAIWYIGSLSMPPRGADTLYTLQDHAFPADELMPLSCKGRVRGVQTSRGDIDDALGRYVRQNYRLFNACGS